MFSFLRIKEYTKLRSHEPVSNPRKLAPANFNDSTVYAYSIIVNFTISDSLAQSAGNLRRLRKSFLI